MKAIFLFLVALLVVMAPLNGDRVSAEEIPVAGRADPRIRSVVYNKDNVVAIDATFGTSTMIVLRTEKKSRRWRRAIPSRGRSSRTKRATSFSSSRSKRCDVESERRDGQRTYSFILRSNMHASQNQIYKVQFRYPDDEADERLLAKAKALAAYPNARQMNVANANYNYGYKGSEINKPSAVFDDGVKTWFVFEGEIPAIYSVDANRNENLINYHREGAYTIVDKVNFQWTLRNGDDATCVFNRRLNKLNQPIGAEPYRPQIVGGPAK